MPSGAGSSSEAVVRLGADTVYLSDITTTPPPNALAGSPSSDHTAENDAGDGISGTSFFFLFFFFLGHGRRLILMSFAFS